MSLVVSDVSNFGIIMVGDSAVTDRENGKLQYLSDAAKVQYSDKANVGFAMWGRVSLPNGVRLDVWLRDFIDNQIERGDAVEAIGEKLAQQLNQLFLDTKSPWQKFGIHLAGYREGIPVLFHVHAGHLNEDAHEVRLYKDYPDQAEIEPHDYAEMLSSGVVHLRNGRHSDFGSLFAVMALHRAIIKQTTGVEIPPPTERGRLEYYKLLIRYVAELLVVAELAPSVNTDLGCIMFHKKGLLFDERKFVVGADHAGSDMEF
jgi:hypothetical protein